MTERLKQSLSAVIDDEAEAFELRRVFDELDRDPHLRDVWERYHLIGNALRSAPRRARPELRERVWRALEAEDDAPAGVAEVSPPRRGNLGRLTGAAVAAGVALAVVVGFNDALTGDDGSVSEVATAGPGDVLETAAMAEPRSGPDARSVSRSDVQRAHAYMLHHTQQQAMNQAGVMSFAKMATYETP